MQNRTFIPSTFAVAAALALSAGATPAHALTPPQIVQRCTHAYDALHSYLGTVSVTATGMGGAAYHTTAQIAFTRPDKIRVSGNGMMSSQYAYVSDGAATFQKMGGNWSKAQNAEMAIAGATGIAQDAGTTVPALLLHTRWGDPFTSGAQYNPAVGTEAVDGHVCYRLTATDATGSKTYWIDRQTFLLRRLVVDVSMGQMHLQQDERITDGRLNAPIPAAVFAAPPGQ